MLGVKGRRLRSKNGIYLGLIIVGIMISPIIMTKGDVLINADSEIMAYWDFNEGSGEHLQDHSNNENHGIINGGEWTTGIDGKALRLDGKDDYVSIPESTSSNLGGADKSFSILIWTMKLSETVDFDYVIFQGEFTANRGLQIGWVNSNHFTFAFWDDDLTTAETYPVESEWHLWAMTYDGETNTRKIYRDTIQVASDIAMEDYLGAGPLNIGRFYTYFFHGTLDEIQIYNRTLSNEEVTQYYQGERSLTPPPDTTTSPPDLTTTSTTPTNTTPITSTAISIPISTSVSTSIPISTSETISVHEFPRVLELLSVIAYSLLKKLRRS